MRLRFSDWKVAALWVAGVVSAALFLAWVLRNESANQLARGAEQAGLRWAQFASRTVPDLDVAFAGSGITSAAREQLMRLRRAEDVFRFKLFDRTGNLVLVSDDLDKASIPASYPASEGIGHSAAAGAKLHIRDQVLAGTPYIELKRESRPDRPPVYSEAYVPVRWNGAVIGVVEVYVDQTAHARSAGLAFARVAAAVAVMLLLLLAAGGTQFWLRLRRQRQAETRVRYLAAHDVLSGALNRASFGEVLQQAAWRRAKGGPPFSLMCIDLDRFKEVNDSLGHAAGDEVLRAATQRLKDCVREGDQVARLGGDEFAILLLGVSSVASVTPLAQRIVDALRQDYQAGDKRVHCGGSVGIAIHGVDATEPDDLLQKADLALYRAKADGRGTFSFYDMDMDRQMQARRELTRDLRDAIAADQMSLHYQPLYGNDTRTLTGYEALLRWRHPTRGNIPPVEFIALAEETGEIEAIGSWVLRRACADAATWPAPLTVAVNLSALQFSGNNLVALVAEALADSGLEPHRLELEITETLLMENTERVMDVLRTLSAMGVSIAMDDFGTGYSSLAYLWRFPFDKVKIDRAFTHNLGSDAKVGVIVRSIIALAHSLDIRVNAEGVETESQMAALQQRGCDEFQGFLLGRPSPGEDLTHDGRASPDQGAEQQQRRSAPRESLFAELTLELPPTRPGGLG